MGKLSNTAVPKYYGQFREDVIRGKIPVCKEISMEMNRIDDLIANPGVYYDEEAVEGFIAFCEDELTLTDGGDLVLLDSFKLWAEQIFCWYYFIIIKFRKSSRLLLPCRYGIVCQSCKFSVYFKRCES